jgi:hypothetical protein
LYNDVNCADIVKSTQCIDSVFSFINEICLLFESQCADVLRGCRNNSIDSKVVCEFPGAVDDDDGAPLECVWLEGNSAEEPVISGRCELKILLDSFIIFFFLILFLFFFCLFACFIRPVLLI